MYEIRKRELYKDVHEEWGWDEDNGKIINGFLEKYDLEEVVLIQ